MLKNETFSDIRVKRFWWTPKRECVPKSVSSQWVRTRLAIVEVTGRKPVGGDLVKVPADDPLLPWSDFDPDALTSGSFHSRYLISLGGF
jgi:hypothetical protein